MAQYTITRTCGHTETVQITGNMSERPRQEAYEATKLCRECYRAAKLAEAQAATGDLLALTGSDKQIAWATTIRAEALAHVDQYDQAEAPVEQRAAVATVRAQLTAHTDSRYWIDNRTTLQSLTGIRQMLRDALA